MIIYITTITKKGIYQDGEDYYIYHPFLKEANKYYASNRRDNGIASKSLERLTIADNISKELICNILNQGGFVTKRETIKSFTYKLI